MNNKADLKVGLSVGRLPIIVATLLIIAALSPVLEAHGVSGKDAVFLQGLKGRAIGPLLYLGAKHMVTGYDHLLFLVGVIFFLYRLKDVVTYVSLFTLGHSVTLLAGVFGGVRANPVILIARSSASRSSIKVREHGWFARFFGFQPKPARGARLRVSTDSVSPSCRTCAVAERPVAKYPCFGSASRSAVPGVTAILIGDSGGAHAALPAPRVCLQHRDGVRLSLSDTSCPAISWREHEHDK